MTAFPRFLPVLLLLLCAGVMPATAQDQDAAQADALPPRGSNRALSFSLDQLSLGAINGGVGGKWWIGPRTALRPSLGFGVESDEDVIGDAVDTGRSAVNGRLSFVVEWHSPEFGRVSPYLASGFAVGAGAFSETTDFSQDNPLRQRREKGSNLEFLVNAGLGAEVRLSRRVSLAGEHLITACVLISDETRREFSRDPEVPTVVTVRDRRTFTLSTGTSRLILSVYF